jgi:hypothetical protein
MSAPSPYTMIYRRVDTAAARVIFFRFFIQVLPSIQIDPSLSAKVEDNVTLIIFFLLGQ